MEAEKKKKKTARRKKTKNRRSIILAEMFASPQRMTMKSVTKVLLMSSINVSHTCVQQLQGQKWANNYRTLAGLIPRERDLRQHVYITESWWCNIALAQCHLYKWQFPARKGTRGFGSLQAPPSCSRWPGPLGGNVRHWEIPGKNFMKGRSGNIFFYEVNKYLTSSHANLSAGFLLKQPRWALITSNCNVWREGTGQFGRRREEDR